MEPPPDFDAQRRKLARGMLVRDLVEGGGGALGAVLFGVWAWRAGRNGWPIAVGAGLILGVSSVFLHNWFRARRARPGRGATVLTKVDADLAELRRQRQLLDNIGKWYAAPYAVAIPLIGYGLAGQAGRHAPPGLLAELLTTPLTLGWIVVLLGTTVTAMVWWWRGIRKLVTQQIDPRIAELEKFRADLTALHR